MSRVSIVQLIISVFQIVVLFWMIEGHMRLARRFPDIAKKHRPSMLIITGFNLATIAAVVMW